MATMNVKIYMAQNNVEIAKAAAKKAQEEASQAKKEAAKAHEDKKGRALFSCQKPKRQEELGLV